VCLVCVCRVCVSCVCVCVRVCVCVCVCVCRVCVCVSCAGVLDCMFLSVNYVYVLLYGNLEWESALVMWRQRNDALHGSSRLTCVCKASAAQAPCALKQDRARQLRAFGATLSIRIGDNDRAIFVPSSRVHFW
jgi:hypothetical protein